MSSANIEFTQVTRLKPEALGEPGKRTFRILVDSGSSAAILWMEKEQVFQLALAIKQLSATISEDEQNTSGTGPVEREAPGLTNLDFRVNKLVLGHDASSGLFVIDAHELKEDEEGEAVEEEKATVRMWANRKQMEDFSQEAFEVVAAGRPPCPLCGAPLGPTGHQCPRTNGHRMSTEL